MIALWWSLVVGFAAPLSADEAVARALHRSVAVAEASAVVESARGASRATALFRSDPVVRGRLAVVGDLHGVSVTQPVSLTGEGLAAHRAAVAGVERARATEARIRLEVAALTRLAWVAAVEARQRVGLAEDALALAIRLREGAEARLATGDGSLLDARLARLQETEARSTWMVAVAEEADRLAALATWTGVAVDAIVLPEDPLAGMAAVPLDAVIRSDLRAALAAVDAARSRLASARAGTLPPLQLGAFYEQEGPELRVGPSVGVTVPIWSRNADERARSRAALAVADAAAAAQERRVDAEQAATAAVSARLEGEGADVDPREEARAALESVAMGFERGELDLLTAGLLRQQVLGGQRAWLEGRRVRAEVRIAAALAHEAPALLGATSQRTGGHEIRGSQEPAGGG